MQTKRWNNKSSYSGGLAGTEARGKLLKLAPVILHEMRPQRFSPPEQLAELVCSNARLGTVERSCRRSITRRTASACSIIISQADKHAVPAGGALAVDRGQFSHDLTETLSSVDFAGGKFMKFQQEL